MDLSSIPSSKTLNLRLKNKWKNGNQKIHRNDCEQSRDGTKDAGMKERLRVVTYTRQHKETKETTGVQVKEAAGKSSKQVDGDFPACMRRENNNNENKARRNEDLKGKGEGRLKLCNVDGDVPLCLRSFDEENKDSSSSKKDNKERTVSGSSVSHSRKNDSRSKMTSGSKDLRAMLLKRKTKNVEKQRANTSRSSCYRKT